MKKVKICFVGNCQSVHLKRWINYFANKFDVYVISSSPCSHKECIHFEDIVPSSWKRLSSLPRVGPLIKAAFLCRYLRTENLDLVHIHYLGSFGTRIGRYLILLRYHPFVVSTWGSDVVGLQDQKERDLRRNVLQKADLVTATSKFLVGETKKLASGLKRVEVVPFGVDLKVFDPARFKQKGMGDGVLHIGFFKHLKPKYGPEYLLRAFKTVLDKFHNAELFIAGRGEMEGELKDMAKKIGVFQQVHFLGFVESVVESMYEMDITVMPSVEDSETFGVAAVESQALGIPVVASGVGGVPEVILDGQTGFLVPPRDEDALAETMIKLLSEKNLRIRMGKVGRKFVSENYDWEENAKRMENLYMGVLSESKC